MNITMFGDRAYEGMRIAHKRAMRYHSIWDGIAPPDDGIPVGFFVKNNVICSCSACKPGGYKSKGKNKRAWKETVHHASSA